MFARIALDTSEYDSGVKDVTKSGESLASKLKSGLATAGKVAATGIGAITAAAGAAVGGLLALEQSTEEYRIAMGRLNTAFESAGYGADAANQAYSEFYGILGDTDRATEASQLLAKLAENEEDLAEWTNIAAGVNGTFGDSLPIESLIEAANETARTGTIVGTLADALNWAGKVGEDEFNAMLASCSSESERNQLIMETLSGTYDDASDAFYRNNEAIIAARNSQVSMDDTLAKLGQTVTTVKNKIINEFLPAISSITLAFSDMLLGVENADKEFSNSITQLINNTVKKLPEFMQLGIDILSAVANGIIQNLPLLVESAIQILTTLIQTIADNLQTIVPTIVSVVTEIVQTIVDNSSLMLQAGLNLILGLAQGILNALPQLISSLPSIITGIVNFFLSSIPQIINTGIQLLTSLVSSLPEIIDAIVIAIPKIITGIVDALNENIPLIVQAGFDLLVALIQALPEIIVEIVKAIPQIITSLVSALVSSIPTLVSTGFDLFVAIIQNLPQIIVEIAKAVPQIISGIVSAFKDMTGTIAEIGTNIVHGIWEGIKGAADWLIGKVTGFFNDIVSGVKDFLGIHSPSTVFADMGKNMALGLGEGWDNSFASVKKSITDGIDFGTASVDFASSGLGVSSAGIVNGMSGAARSSGGSYSFNLILPTGEKLASYVFTPLTDYAKANGTPILNPI